jgi:hypothetical protein
VQEGMDWSAAAEGELAVGDAAAAGGRCLRVVVVGGGEEEDPVARGGDGAA